MKVVVRVSLRVSREMEHENIEDVGRGLMDSLRKLGWHVDSPDVQIEAYGDLAQPREVSA